jgi:hypothetical protein
MKMRKWVWVAATQVVALAGCVPQTMAPTVVVTPGSGKSTADFAADQSGCTAQANQQMAPAVQAANSQLVGNALLGVTPDQTVQSAQSAQTTLQQQYNVAYSECMYAKGEFVPGMTPVATEPESSPEPQHVRRYAHKKPAQQPTSAAAAEPAATAPAASAAFVEPAPAPPATPASASGGFAVPPPASR